jgi:hypothetical protein
LPRRRHKIQKQQEKREKYRIEGSGRGGIEVKPKDEVGDRVELICFDERQASCIAAAKNKSSERGSGTLLITAITRITVRS